jgi:agmatine deiminase
MQQLSDPQIPIPAQRRLPAEWEPAGAVLLAWPRADGDWAPYLDEVRACYRRLLAELSAVVPVLLLVDEAERALQELGPSLALLTQQPHAQPRLRLLASPARDTWTRDYGPITVLEGPGQPLLLNFAFNGWGGKYASGGDDAATRALHASGALGSLPLERHELVLEGGSIDGDGQGTLLTTSTCLLAPSRNPRLDRSALEAELKRLLGVERVLWLQQSALAGDDTDAHIDTLVRFCPDDTLVYVRRDQELALPASAAPADDPLERQLRTLRTPEGRPYRLVALPAGPLRHAPDDGRPLPATYANALFLNGSVFLPVYGDPERDAAAVAAWQQACPGWRIAPLDCSALLLQHGSLHCATMQIPAAVFR